MEQISALTDPVEVGSVIPLHSTRPSLQACPCSSPVGTELPPGTCRKSAEPVVAPPFQLTHQVICLVPIGGKQVMGQGQAQSVLVQETPNEETGSRGAEVPD